MMRAREFVRTIVLLDDGAPREDVAAFEAWARHRTMVLTRAFAAGLLVLCVAWWPTDLLLFSDPQMLAAMTRWRSEGSVVLAGILLALMLPIGRRHPAFVLASMSTVATFLTATILGDKGRYGPSLLFGFYVTVFASLAYIGPLLPRLAGLLVCTAIAVGSYFAGHHEWLSDPLTVDFLSLLFFACLCAALAGHMTYVPVRRSFLDRRELARVNGQLDLRVRQKTADLALAVEHLQVAQEEERGRIARELHDELGQRLSALRYALVTTRQRFGSVPEGVGPNLEEIDALVDGTVHCIHGIVSGLRPQVLDELGLLRAVEWLTTETARRTGIACRLDLPEGDAAVDPTLSLAVYRVFQEAITNVTRHAAAKEVGVTLRVSPTLLFLEVVDDGRGYPEAAGQRADRNGLFGMRERAFAVGGHLQTDNVPSGGARVRLSVPTADARSS